MSALIERVRQPAYVGPNRCVPCTAVNLLVAAGLTLAVFAVGDALAGTPVAVAAATATAAGSLASIYLRGYLVPGTPSLTRRYLPPRVLRWFGKTPSPVSPDGEDDPTAILEALGALAAAPDGGEYHLTDEFRSGWRDSADAVGTGATIDALVERCARDEEPTVERHPDGGGQLVLGGDVVGRWPSTPAVLADLAAAERFAADRPAAWHALDLHVRLAALRELRTYLSACPACGGRVELGQQEVDRCCLDEFLPVLSCVDCGAELQELASSPGDA